MTLSANPPYNGWTKRNTYNKGPCMWELVADQDGFQFLRRITLDEYARLEPKGFRIHRCYYTKDEALRAAAAWNETKARLLKIEAQKMLEKANGILADVEVLKEC